MVKNPSKTIKTLKTKNKSDTIVFHNCNGINHFARDFKLEKVNNASYYLEKVAEAANK